jgi:hypothetical protein
MKLKEKNVKGNEKPLVRWEMASLGSLEWYLVVDGGENDGVQFSFLFKCHESGTLSFGASF